ncbi:MAG: hypothetical protein AAB365_01780 [Patescibacteria group bacterium]
MKKLASLIIIAAVLIPLSLYANSFNLTLTFCNGLDCGDVTAPSTPTNLEAEAVSTSQINLSWDASIDPGFPALGILGYKIYRNGGGTEVATTTGLSYSDTGLADGTLYTYTVSAFDGAYNESAQSSSVSTTTLSVPSVAPNASNGSPSGTFAAGTTETTLSLATDIAATCKYGTVADTAYAALPNTFSTTGGTAHSKLLSGLANGVTYTYYVRCQSTTNVAMTSDYTISFAVASAPVRVPGGGGGDKDELPLSQVNVIVRGIAYPGSTINLLKDGLAVASTQAGPDANFEIQLSGVGSGTFTFSVWAMDSQGVRSTLYPFTVTLTSGVTTVIGGVFIPPTVSLDLSTVKRGDPLRVLGQTVPNATVSLIFHSDTEIIDQVAADARGVWNYVLDTLKLEYGDHTAQARAAKATDISTLSKTLSFKVGTVNIPVKKETSALIGDYNADKKVDLVDFSIMLYWYKRPLATTAPPVDLNRDGKLDLVDFSIFAYHWTG